MNKPEIDEFIKESWQLTMNPKHPQTAFLKALVKLPREVTQGIPLETLDAAQWVFRNRNQFEQLAQ